MNGFTRAGLTRTFERLEAWARALRRDIIALWLAARDARTPLGAKLVTGAVAAYALSPIDLVPDFIPVVGYLDDLVLVPTGIALAIRLVPPVLMKEFRARAEERTARPTSIVAAGVVIILWSLAVGGVVYWWCLQA